MTALTRSGRGKWAQRLFLVNHSRVRLLSSYHALLTELDQHIRQRSQSAPYKPPVLSSEKAFEGFSVLCVSFLLGQQQILSLVLEEARRNTNFRAPRITKA